MRQAQVDGQGERRECIGGDGQHLKVADDRGGAQVFETALPVLALGAAEDALDVEEARGELDPGVGGGAGNGDGGVVAQHDALAAPPVPVEEGVGAGEHLGGEGAGGGEEAVALDRGGANLFVAPLAGDATEGVFDVAEGAHLPGQEIAHAAGARHRRRGRGHGSDVSHGFRSV